MKLKFKLLNLEAKQPTYATSGSAGFDLSSIQTLDLLPQSTTLVSTGLSFEIPEGYELQIRPRSGLSLKTSLRISNSPGTIDSDYRGEVKIIVTNSHLTRVFKVMKGDRIAQAILCPVIRAEFEEVYESLGSTERSDAGFGSTGV